MCTNSSRSEGIASKFFQLLKKKIIPILKTRNKKTKPSLPEHENEGILPTSFYETSVTLIPNPDEDIIRKENYRPIISHVSYKDKNPKQNISKSNLVIKKNDIKIMNKWGLFQECKGGLKFIAFLKRKNLFHCFDNVEHVFDVQPGRKIGKILAETSQKRIWE